MIIIMGGNFTLRGELGEEIKAIEGETSLGMLCVSREDPRAHELGSDK